MRRKVVYCINNLVNQKKYIGSTINYQRRKKGHLYLLRRGKSSSYPLQNAWFKYGEQSFEWEILEDLKEGDDPVLKEEEWILRLGSITNGYNIKLPYTQQKLSNTQYCMSFNAKEWMLKNGPPRLKYMSKEEWIKKKKENENFLMPKNRYIKKGGVEKTRKSVIRIDIISKEEVEYQSIREAATKNSIIEKRLSRVLNINKNRIEKLRSWKGYIWVFKKL